MANQLVGKQNMAMVSEMLDDPGFSYYCLVDSAELVEQLGAFFAERQQRLQVLLEVGVMGGRAGVRDEEQLQAVLAALVRWEKSIALCGVEVYEGVLNDESSIRAFLKRAVEITRRLIAEGRLKSVPAVLTGAGSAWYDIVAEEFTGATFGDAVEIVLRPGCYVTHDVGSYKKAQARILEKNPIARKMKEGLLPALHIWAYVQSVPEEGKAIITMGRRDAAFDSGLPTPALHYRRGEAGPKAAPAHWVVTKMLDQHAFMQIGEKDEVRVGDMIGFDISHPCLTFDKWRVVPVVDAEYRVVDVVRTFF
jgi:D-serine dehydratase